LGDVDLEMPDKPEEQSEKPVPVHGTVGIHADAKTESDAEVQIRLFQDAVRAVHVRPIEEGWEVFRVGTKAIPFYEKSLAIEFAEIDAKKHRVDTVIHESGHAHTIKHSDD
jgi:hypothetical protein